MMRIRVLLGVFAVLGCASVEATPAAAPTQAPTPEVAVHETAVAAAKTDLVSETWVGFTQRRDGYVDEVGETLLACAKPKAAPECERRKETFEVAYALAALHRITNDGKYQEAARVAIDKRALRKIDDADAYTSSWFLLLARELGDDSLHSQANDVALRLEGWLGDLDDYSFAQGSMFGNEKNVAFVLGTLWAWAQHVKDEPMQARLSSLTQDRMLAAEMDGWCPLPIDSEPENHEFLPPCLQRATTVLSVMPSQMSNPWLSQFLAAQIKLEPIRDPKLSTHATLNFARAWSLWAVYASTSDAVYRDLYVAHVTAQMDRRDKADPWQAAFAVHALAQSY